ncbi:hypothetical protein CCR94_08125 [Rhodoblastus sphagnicola]|uniref:Uncharacterized protein n=1 Tax=Rhodoblastus sphagnicola TaxID=333368 RepID=A0A2S6NAT8_9HYPH|nr:hypothetical protein [Rhodoblastus sphagnicola]MBB4198982.1 hypothetical protein [Rhodoblastus sphagnicola]PPQ31742.1 hypothetical protein CCR94_08125 [Rhodoblastus sphagnicola]
MVLSVVANPDPADVARSARRERGGDAPHAGVARGAKHALGMGWPSVMAVLAEFGHGIRLAARKRLMRLIPGAGIKTRPRAAARAACVPPVARAAETAALLRFPIRGEALLVGLAKCLRMRIAAMGIPGDLVVLEIERGDRSCLRIDDASYIAFDPREAVYDLILHFAEDTTMRIETASVDVLMQFVVQYLEAKQADLTSGEAFA